MLIRDNNAFTGGWPERCPPPSSVLKFSICDQDRNYQVDTEWGDACQFGTPAYWVAQCLITYGANNSDHHWEYCIGNNLLEETVACLLGGYGIRGEIGLSAFYRLQKYNIFDKPDSLSVELISDILSEPLTINGNKYKYRFPNQRAKRIVNAIDYFNDNEPPEDHILLREWLMAINGIGLKTASWIVRNYTASDEVAVIDIHIHRALLSAGIFNSDWVLPRDYYLMEKAFLMLAKLGCICPQELDIIIWQQMRTLRGKSTLRWDFNISIGKSSSAVPIELLFN